MTEPVRGSWSLLGAPSDASQLKWRIQSRTGKPVAVVSDGTAQEAPPDNGQMVHLGPPPQWYGYPTYGHGGRWVPALQYEARRQYVANEAPPRAALGRRRGVSRLVPSRGDSLPCSGAPRVGAPGHHRCRLTHGKNGEQGRGMGGNILRCHTSRWVWAVWHSGVVVAHPHR
ncbi:hypothetical protein C2845_PM09G08260 [Panicum miliaceum]|uniref:Uncharacterized protein n=1 Tax=Panicum miliaceum TaxID=4540 RepID=A0A3L6RZ81_PANMI|nr:hypothetical protein C2845_PM09G08260 [Panicum miliaceum]